MQIAYPPMNSYQRLILHRIAEHFGLAHIVDKQKVAVIIFKKEGAEMYVLINLKAVASAHILDAKIGGPKGVVGPLHLTCRLLNVHKCVTALVVALILFHSLRLSVNS